VFADGENAGDAFRGKFLHGLARLHAQRKIQLGNELARPDAFDQLCRTLFDKP
jgi:hypothetical protein